MRRLWAYFAKQLQIFLPPVSTDTTVFFGKPDRTYLLDDYTRFTTMEEVMKEYVPEIRIRSVVINFITRLIICPIKLFSKKTLGFIRWCAGFRCGKIMTLIPLK